MEPTASTATVPVWVRVGLVALGLPNALIGLWALVAPANWYHHFPGWDPRLVAAEPPFNRHLVTDAGAGLFASGIVLLAGAWLGERRAAQLALVTFAAFAVPHALFHVTHPSPLLTTAQDAQNAGVLIFLVAATVVLLVGSGRAPAPSRA